MSIGLAGLRSKQEKVVEADTAVDLPEQAPIAVRSARVLNDWLGGSLSASQPSTPILNGRREAEVNLDNPARRSESAPQIRAFRRRGKVQPSGRFSAPLTDRRGRQARITRGFVTALLVATAGAGLATTMKSGHELSAFVSGQTPKQLIHHAIHDLTIDNGKFNEARLQALSSDPFDLDELQTAAKAALARSRQHLQKISANRDFAKNVAIVDQSLRDEAIDAERYFAALKSADFDAASRMASSTGKWRAETVTVATKTLQRQEGRLAKLTPERAAITMALGLWVATSAAMALARRRFKRREMKPGLSAMLQATTDAHVAIDLNGTIVAASDSVVRLTNRKATDLVGKSCHELVPLSEREGLELARQTASATGEAQTLTVETENAGARRQFRASVVRVDGWDGVVMVFAERTAENALEAELITKAFHDSLTGLANRGLFRTRVQAAIDMRKRNEGIVTVLFMDLDGFKNVNDSLGHEAGDELLNEVAFRLTTLLRPGDTLARLGGDEFALVLIDPRPKFGQLVADRILGVMSQPIRLRHRHVSVGASIGLAEAREGDSVEDLLRNADTAMYAAKENGKNRVERFRPEMFTEALKRLEIDADLRTAIENGQLFLHYQPVIDLKSGQMHSVEALMRWKHPKRGLVPPSVFIPIAEETGSIVELGRWALQTAIAFAATIPPPVEALRVNVNLSARQLDDPTLVELIANELSMRNVDPQRLVLEVTESVVVNEVDRAIARLQEFKALGCLLALDDFGTGYSSLSHLKRMPIDILKIDRAFVTDIGQVADDSFVQAIIELGQTLGMQTVAEGIETQEQLDWLRHAGCSSGQGFYLAKPMLDSDVRAALEIESPFTALR
jgi:diguanylate cyclase (GGDEF)-like protein/PAS domain S-box-containing protein